MEHLKEKKKRERGRRGEGRREEPGERESLLSFGRSSGSPAAARSGHFGVVTGQAKPRPPGPVITEAARGRGGTSDDLQPSLCLHRHLLGQPPPITACRPGPRSVCALVRQAGEGAGDKSHCSQRGQCSRERDLEGVPPGCNPRGWVLMEGGENQRGRESGGGAQKAEDPGVMQRRRKGRGYGGGVV